MSENNEAVKSPVGNLFTLFTVLPTRWLLGNLASRKKPEAWKRAEVPR
jgi:hypothetical protein